MFISPLIKHRLNRSNWQKSGLKRIMRNNEQDEAQILNKLKASGMNVGILQICGRE